MSSDKLKDMSSSSVVSSIAHTTSDSIPAFVPQANWWQHLRHDFAYQRESFDLRSRDWPRVLAASTFDYGLRTFCASVVAATAIPVGYHPVNLVRTLRDREFYVPMAKSGDPTQFMHEPGPIDVRTSRATWFPRFEPKDGLCEEVRFESPFEPVNPRLRESYASHKRNRTAHIRYLRHRDGKPRPTIVTLHGFAADYYVLNEWFFALPWFFRMGCDIALVTLPFHGPRGGVFAPYSGHGFFAHGASHFNEAAAQSVMDVRAFIRWLREERGVSQVGVTGLSLGGFVSSLLACLEPDLSFVVPNVPVVSIADLILEWKPLGWLFDAALKLAPGMDIVSAREMLAVTGPLSYRPVVKKERLMIVGGAGDRIVPPKHSRLLWEHWGRPNIHWFAGSHIIHMDRGGYLMEMARFMSELGFIQEERLSAPPPQLAAEA